VLSLSALLLAGLLGGYLLQADYRQQYRYAQLRNIQLGQQIVTLNQKASVLPATGIPTSVTASPVFSVIETLRKSGGRLVSWQPGEPQATLELLLAWDQVPYFFQHISYYQDVNLTSFIINGTKDSMIVALTLAFRYENK
jgi:hypothetical protein